MSHPNIQPINEWGQAVVETPEYTKIALCDPVTGESLTGRDYSKSPTTPPYFTSEPALEPGYRYWRNSYAADSEAQLTVYFTDPMNPNGFDVDDFRDNVIGRTPKTRNYDVVLFDFMQGAYETGLGNHERARQGLSADPAIEEAGVDSDFLDKFFDIVGNTAAEVRMIDIPVDETESGLLVPTEKSGRIVKALREIIGTLAQEQDFDDPEGPDARFMTADMVSENVHQHYDTGRSGAILQQIVAPRRDQSRLPDVLIALPNSQRDFVRKLRLAGALSVRGYDGVARDEQTVEDNELYGSAMATGFVEFE